MNWKPLLPAIIFALGLIAGQPARAAAPPDDLAAKVAEIDHDRILKLAEDALALSPPAITDQTATNSAGGPHDFFSQADYDWPNPTNPSGLPYVYRDGQSNPDTFTYHRLAMRRMKDAVAALAAAYALTGDDRYAWKSAALLQVFFLDPKTGMDPNLKYAQAVLGASTGNPYGVIDTLHLAELPQAIKFLERSPAFPPAIDRGMKHWFADYTRWILTSTNGMKEANSANNHSIACFVQLASFANFTGDQKVLDFARQRFKDVLLPRQMTNNGSFPLELKRTKPYGYSIFQADNLSLLCRLLSTTNDDLWKFTLPDGRTPRQAIDFIYPYLADKKQWLADGRGQDVMHWDDWPVRQICLLLAYAEFGDDQYFALWKKLNADPKDLEVRRNLAVTQPLLWIADPAATPLLAPHLSDQELAKTYKTNGFIFIEFSEWALAIRDLQKSVAVITNDPIVYDALAAAYLASGHAPEAIKCYDREVEIDPYRAMAWLNRGNAWRALNEYDRAIADLGQSLKLGLTNSMVYKLRASAEYGKQDYDAEIDDLNTCLRLRPWDITILDMRGEAYGKLGRFKEAVADYQQAMTNDPPDVEACNDYAWYLATCPASDVRDGRAAVAAAVKACVHTRWQNWAFLDTLAAAYAEAGDFSQATNYERQAIAKVLTSDPSRKEMIQHELSFEMHEPWRETP